MADRIKGITVQLGGDTTGLSKALKSVNKEITATKTQLKDVNRLLKLDPTNTKLLAQKQRLLSGEIDTTKQKLSSLKEAEKQVQQQFAEGKVSQEQYDALQREIADTEQKLKSLKKEAQDFGSTFKQVMGEAGSKLQNLGSTLTGAGQKMLPVTGAIAGIGAAAVKVGADFDSSMSKVKALSGANEEQFAQLRQAALDAGETTAFSASEAADALGYMALAGWDADQSMTALPGVLDLAAASGMDLAAASDMVTDYLSAFGLEAAQASSFSDMLAYAQANSNTTADQLGEAYKNCAATLHGAGQDVETVTSLLEALANQGLKGSEAGTAVSAIMRDITAKMSDGAIKIGDASVAVQDADGNFRDLTDILTDVEAATEGMGTAQQAAALSGTFTADSIKGLNMVLTEGMGNVADYEEQLRGSLGTAGEQASTMLDNFSGQMTLLQSALQSGAIAISDVLTPVISRLVGYVQQAVDWFNSLDEGQKKIIVIIAMVVAAIGPLLMILGSIASGIGSIITLVGLIASPVGLVVAAVVAAGVLIGAVVAAIMTHLDEFKQYFNDVAANFGEVWQSVIDDATQGWEAFKDAFKAVVNAIIGFVNGMISAVVSGVNAIISALNGLSFDVPDWVPGLGGKKFGFEISQVMAPQIPLLAKGGTLLRGSAIVGEAGPELLSLTGGGVRVTPLGNDNARAAGNTVYLTAHFSGYCEEDARRLVRLVNRELGRAT